MASDLMVALEALASEKQIDEMYLLERLERSLAESYERILDLPENRTRVTINRENGQIYVFELVPLGEPDEETGEYLDFEERDVTPSDVSRIAAQNAKSVINNIVRDAGRQQIYAEFSERRGELVNGTVLQSTADFTIIKIRDGVEAELPHFDLKRYPEERNEKPEAEYYRHNQRLRSLIIAVRDPSHRDGSVRNESTRPSIVVSRSHPDLIRRLFEMEVPEIYDGVVEIKNIAREAGARSKVAVASRDSNLDPVGACVGPKGSRVRMVVEELRSERVDVIQWDENPVNYVKNALSPAKVTSVLISDDRPNHATVIVPDDQLSLAIGKEGQNARLAAKLTGWHIDIKSSSFVSDMPGISDSLIDDDETRGSEDGRCEYVATSGLRCPNRALEHSRYCRLHSQPGGASLAEDDELGDEIAGSASGVVGAGADDIELADLFDDEEESS